jgi:hypothetical protein
MDEYQKNEEFKKVISECFSKINLNIFELAGAINAIKATSIELKNTLDKNEQTATTLNKRLLFLNRILAVATSVMAIAGIIALFVK